MSPITAHLRNISHLLVLALLATLVMCGPSTNAAEQKYWELSPYRVQLHLAVDDSYRPQPELGPRLVADLQQQIRATIYPLWTTKITLATGPEKQRLLTQLDTLEKNPAGNFDVEKLTLGCDKQIFVIVVSTPLGMTLKSRELDCTTRRWGAVQQRQVRQAWMLSTQCLDLVCQTFSPLATIRPIQGDDKEKAQALNKNVLLRFRGSDLPQQTDLSFLTVPGEAYQPLMVRTSSSGEVKADSIRDIPWTYLTLGEKKEDGWHAAVHTGTRRPFGVRRRGRIEHLALAIRKPTGTTKVRFHARHDATQGLSGYEVFRREPNAIDSQPMGLTDTVGAVEVLPGESVVTLLFLRSEGQLLAKVPVVPGAKPVIEVPIADDTARLRAQASLTSLTERLIDTVAQRNILIARVRDRIKNGNLDEAQKLFTDLDNLPGRAKFNQDIKSAENRKLNHSNDPKVQARIEKLFADTRKLLGRFLNTRQISELQGELTTARREKSS
ncbi:MAG: hypothetical protein GXP24_12095 [Planctomycetes bacterium]|nr:hypothetical protein [Planctomycetota bacterium]